MLVSFSFNKLAFLLSLIKKDLMKSLNIILVSIFLAGSLIGNAQTREKREIESFDKIDVFGNMKVIMKEGKQETVEIFAKKVAIDQIDISVNDKRLKIKMKSNLFDEDVEVKIYVTYKEIREISTNGAAEIIINDIIKTDKLFIDATSGARVKLQVDLNAIDLKVYQGAHIDISGKSLLQESFVNTGGVLSGSNFASNEVFIKMNTGGKAEVIVNQSLDASVNTGASLNYFGNPEKQNIKSTLGGKINAWDKNGAR